MYSYTCTQSIQKQIVLNYVKSKASEDYSIKDVKNYYRGNLVSYRINRLLISYLICKQAELTAFKSVLFEQKKSKSLPWFNIPSVHWLLDQIWSKKLSPMKFCDKLDKLYKVLIIACTRVESPCCIWLWRYVKKLDVEWLIRWLKCCYLDNKSRPKHAFLDDEFSDPETCPSSERKKKMSTVQCV